MEGGVEVGKPTIEQLRERKAKLDQAIKENQEKLRELGKNVTRARRGSAQENAALGAAVRESLGIRTEKEWYAWLKERRTDPLRVKGKKPPSGFKCKLCANGGAELIDPLLSQGHTVLCLMWYLRTLNLCRSAGTIERHLLRHRGGCQLQMEKQDRDGCFRYVPYVPSGSVMPEGASPELLLIRGAIGTGKTELAATFTQTHVHVEADQFFFNVHGWHEFYGNRQELAGRKKAAHTYARLVTGALLRSGRNVVVANTFPLNAWLEPYYSMAVEIGARVRLLRTPGPQKFHIQGWWYTMEETRRPDGLDSWKDDGVMSAVMREEIPSTEHQCQPAVCDAWRVNGGRPGLEIVAAVPWPEEIIKAI
jgi:hypothetical protein